MCLCLSLASHTQTTPPTMRPFFKIIKSYVYLLVILWYPTLQVSFSLFTLLNSSFFCQLFLPPNIHSVSNSCNISVDHVFGKFLGFLALNHILCQLGGAVSTRPGVFQLTSPVRFSPSQFHMGI